MIQDDADVSPAAPHLAPDERARVIGDPADGAFSQAVEFGVVPCPGDGRSRRVDMCGSRSCGHDGKRAETGVREEVEHVGELRPIGRIGGFDDPLDCSSQPGPIAGLLRKEAHLARRRQAQLAAEAVFRDRPGLERPAIAGRPPIVHDMAVRHPLVPGVGRPPCRRIRARQTIERRPRPVHHDRSEPLEPATLAHVEQRMVGARERASHAGIMPVLPTRRIAQDA